MVNAVKYHTTGHPNMDMLAKVIFISDKIEENRDYEGVEETPIECLYLCSVNLSFISLFICSSKLSIFNPFPSPSEIEEYISKYNVELDEIEKSNIELIHAKIGADISKRKYNFDDQMVNARH